MICRAAELWGDCIKRYVESHPMFDSAGDFFTNHEEVPREQKRREQIIKFMSDGVVEILKDYKAHLDKRAGR